MAAGAAPMVVRASTPLSSSSLAATSGSSPLTVALAAAAHGVAAQLHLLEASAGATTSLTPTAQDSCSGSDKSVASAAAPSSLVPSAKGSSSSSSMAVASGPTIVATVCDGGQSLGTKEAASMHPRVSPLAGGSTASAKLPASASSNGTACDSSGTTSEKGLVAAALAGGGFTSSRVRPRFFGGGGPCDGHGYSGGMAHWQHHSGRAAAKPLLQGSSPHSSSVHAWCSLLNDGEQQLPCTQFSMVR